MGVVGEGVLTTVVKVNGGKAFRGIGLTMVVKVKG